MAQGVAEWKSAKVCDRMWLRFEKIFSDPTSNVTGLRKKTSNKPVLEYFSKAFK
jgi:hypothetical protein